MMHIIKYLNISLLSCKHSRGQIKTAYETIRLPGVNTGPVSGGNPGTTPDIQPIRLTLQELDAKRILVSF